MSEAAQAALIERLSESLVPVRRLAPPWVRAARWLAAVLWLGLLLLPFADLPALEARMMATPDLGLAALGEVLTAGLAVWSAFETSVPGRGRFWAWVPVPALLLWVGASTAGCLRSWVAPATVPEPVTHPIWCIYMLLVLALPLAGGLGWMLRRAMPLRTGVTAWLAGLASAGAAGALLTLVHPFDASAEDLLAHGAAVGGILVMARSQRHLLSG